MFERKNQLQGFCLGLSLSAYLVACNGNPRTRVSEPAVDATFGSVLPDSDTGGSPVQPIEKAKTTSPTQASPSTLETKAAAADGFINASEIGGTDALWEADPTFVGSTSYTVVLDDAANKLVCDASQSYSSPSIPSARDISSDGTWSFCIRYAAADGQISYGKGKPIVRDATVPLFTSLAAANAASDLFINDSEKLLISPLWTLSASGHSEAAYSIALSDTGGALSCTASQTYDQSSIAIPSSLSADGVFAQCIRLRDAAGNTTYGKSASITRDIQAATLTSLNGANAASDLAIKSGEENATDPLYTLVADGHSIDDFTLALADDPAITCNSTQTYGQATIPLINSIGSDGSYAVCVKLTDAAGNTTYGKSQQILRDIIAPNFTSLSGANEAADSYIADGEKGSTAAGWNLSASGYSAANYTLVLDDTSAALTCDGGKTYSSSIPSINSMTTDGPWAVCVRLTDTAGNITYGKSQQITRDTIPPSVPGSLTASPGNRIIDLKWTVSTGTPAGYVLVRGPAGSAPTFTPSDGQTYATGVNGADTIIYVGLATLKLDDQLLIGSNYSYKVFTYDAARGYSASASASATPLTPCATGYVFVPGDADYGTKDFCVMKYEAKDVGGFATSQAALAPWVNISQQNSVTKCAANGVAYQLISNSQWMTLGTQVAALDSNWTGGTVGTGGLFSGHNDNDPSTPCAASSNDGLFYVETNCTPAGSGDSSDQRRTLALASSEVIWDLSGNIADAVNYININDKPGASASWYQYTALTGTKTTPLKELIPTNAVKAFWSDSWNATQMIGQIYPGPNGSGGALQRGGYWDTGANAGAGVFKVNLNDAPNYEGIDAGFRCIQSLPDLDVAALALSAGNSQITATWPAVGGASGYILVRGPAGSRPVFQPVNGTAYSAGSQGNDQIVYAGPALTYTNTGLDNHREYHYALYSFDVSTVYSSPSRSKDMPLACPTGFILVPGDNNYGTDDFCVMKYEAKNIGGVAASRVENAPWINITQQNSLTACSALGPGYDLIANPEWMTLASHIAARGENWSSGTVGTGHLYAGHNDSDPYYPCQASPSENHVYVENNCTPKATGQGENSEATQKRTFTMTNGEVIWDLAGNVWDFVNYYNVSDKPNAVHAFVSYPNLTPTTSMSLAAFVPTHAVKSYWNDTWDENQRIGQFWPGPNNNGTGAFDRGGAFGNGGATGLFAADLNASPTSTYDYIGFRCVLKGLAPHTPRSFAAVASANSVSLSWEKGSSSTTGYLLVRGEAGKLPIFQPSRGTSYSTGAQGNDSIIYVGSATSTLNTSLPTGGNFHYRLYGFDSARNYSSAALQSVYVTPCAENFVFVPGDSDYGTNDFCVMKYEAKSSGTAIPAALAQAASAPWTSISQNVAITKCSAMGTGYHLTNNEEWMTFGAIIAARGENWSGGTVGSGALFAGHSDNSPTSACEASTDDSLFYVESTCTPVSTGDTNDQKRTFSLSDHGVVWDISSNVWEWVNYVNSTDKPSAASAWVEFSGLSGTSTTPLKYLIPTHAVKSFWSDSWTSTQMIGQFNSGTNGSNGALKRGSAWGDGALVGLFNSTLDFSPVSSFNYIGFRCTQHLPDLDSTTLTLTPSSTSISATWTSSGASGYLLARGSAGTEPSFTPENGSSYASGEQQGSDTILFSGSNLSYLNTGITDNAKYHYSLYSYDSSNNYSLIARGQEVPLSCPSGFVHVPGDKDYATEDFCVMKYEAKNNGSNVAISRAASLPWISISQQDAKTECTAMGLGYDLISNDEWMTVGANAASRNDNWTGGSVGSGFLIAGHVDNSPTSACAASSDDSLFYVENDCTPISSGDDPQYRRTLTLSNSVVIWDLPGNVYEWVNYQNSVDKPGATYNGYEFSAISGTATTALKELVPTNAVKAYWSDSWNSGKWIGMLYPGTNNAGGALSRGGDWEDSTFAGVFTAVLSDLPTDTRLDFSFRCTSSRQP